MFTKQLLVAINALAKKYSNIEGDYESTLIKGVAHSMCDSGIFTDSFSVEDAAKVQQRLADVEYNSDNFYEKLFNMQDLHCVQLTDAINELAFKYKVSNEDIAHELANTGI